MLKDYLKEHGISIYKLSAECGIPYSTLNDVVNGKVEISNVKSGVLFALAECLQMTMDELYRLSRRTITVKSERYGTEGFVSVRNKMYYVTFEYHGVRYEEQLYPVKKEVTLFIQDIALWRMEDCLLDAEMEEVYAVYLKKI